MNVRVKYLYVLSPSTWTFCFLNEYDWTREWWKSFEKGKQKVSSVVIKHTSQETGPGPDSTFHTIDSQQYNKPCPLQTHYCTGARHSCGESHLSVRGNKCFFNWNSAISSCFLLMLYESPVPIVWKFALTSPWRPHLIERVCVWTKFKRKWRFSFSSFCVQVCVYTRMCVSILSQIYSKSLCVVLILNQP